MSNAPPSSDLSYDFSIAVVGEPGSGKTYLCTRLENPRDPPSEIQRKYKQNITAPVQEFYFVVYPPDSSRSAPNSNVAVTLVDDRSGPLLERSSGGPTSQFRFRLVDRPSNLPPPSNPSNGRMYGDANGVLIVLRVTDFVEEYAQDEKEFGENLRVMMMEYYNNTNNSLIGAVVFTFCDENLLSESFRDTVQDVLSGLNVLTVSFVDLTRATEEVMNEIVSEMMQRIVSRVTPRSRNNSVMNPNSTKQNTKKSCAC